ncbi:MAG: hypothetical protein IJS53_01755 [Clostridia bacterium]|nr:hypothetical protein [Clostridia bacterium]
MAEKIVLLYETDYGKAVCDAASRVLAQVAVAFGHALTVPVMRCEAVEEVGDGVLDLCDGAGAVLAGESGMRCLPALADELLCASRLRELRYAHLVPCRSLMGQPLNLVLLQALTNDEEALRATARLGFDLSARENLPVCQVPPAG